MGEKILKDVLRSKVINEALGTSKFTWVKEFVYSNIIKEEVAIAGIENNMVLINKVGTIFLLLDNM